MKKHLGSTVALILGTLALVAGLAHPSSTLTAGAIIIVGALAYRSAKKRKLGEVKTSITRQILEIIALILIAAAVLLQNDAAKQIETDPVPNLIIPLWAIIAYVVLIFKAQRTASSEKAGND